MCEPTITRLFINSTVRLAEKRLRYEKVMADLKREQEIIDEQQSKVSGGEAIGVDEEF